MANNDAQNPNDRSLNIKPDQFNTPTNKRMNKKPLINPLSEMNNQKDSSPEAHGFDWNGMFNHSYLSVYLKPNDPLVESKQFDYAFYVGKSRFYVLVHEETIDVNSTELPIQVLEGLKQTAAMAITKRFQQLGQRYELPIADELDDVDHVHYLGLTLLSVQYGDKSYQVDHEFGSQFFQEDCVLDLDDENKVLQVFGLNSFLKILKLLQTPSDFNAYLEYHLAKLVNYEAFSSESELSQTFLNNPTFFKRAIAVQEKLVDIGLLSNVETRLTKIASLLDSADSSKNTEYDKEQHEALITNLQNYATMYQKLINSAVKRRHLDNNTIPIEQVKMLVNESMYTRMSIMEELVAYEKRSEQDISQGYISHQHSYNDFGHHYVLVVYGLQENAEFNKTSMQQDYSQILTEINAQLQDPAMSEYFLLAFDMSNHDGKGNVSVQMDVFHQSGQPL